MVIMCQIYTCINYIDAKCIINITYIIVLSLFSIKARIEKKMTTSSNKAKRKYWLEYADDRYNAQEISESRSALAVIYLFIPVPMFFALFDQQVSFS